MGNFSYTLIKTVGHGYSPLAETAVKQCILIGSRVAVPGKAFAVDKEFVVSDDGRPEHPRKRIKPLKGNQQFRKQQVNRVPLPEMDPLMPDDLIQIGVLQLIAGDHQPAEQGKGRYLSLGDHQDHILQPFPLRADDQPDDS